MTYQMVYSEKVELNDRANLSNAVQELQQWDNDGTQRSAGGTIEYRGLYHYNQEGEVRILLAVTEIPQDVVPSDVESEFEDALTMLENKASLRLPPASNAEVKSSGI